MAGRIDFNCDMGESFGMYKMGYDEEVIKYITSANIACGFHAGDPGWMRWTVKLAEERGVGVGAHPSFPDLAGFGRRNMTASPDEVRNDVIYQMGALQAFTKAGKLQHVKPHGAMYNMAVDDEDLARAICEAVIEVDSNVALLALAGSRWIDVAQDMGLRVGREVFADRALNPDGTLVSRSKEGSVIHDTGEVVERSLRMVTEGKATAITGDLIELDADSLCLHGDTPGAVEMAQGAQERARVRGGGYHPARRACLRMPAYDQPKLMPAGDHAVVVEYGDEIDPAINSVVHRAVAAIERADIDGVVEVVPTYRSTLVYYDPFQSLSTTSPRRCAASRSTPAKPKMSAESWRYRLSMAATTVQTCPSWRATRA